MVVKKQPNKNDDEVEDPNQKEEAVLDLDTLLEEVDKKAKAAEDLEKGSAKK